MTFLTVWYENPAIVGLIIAVPSAVLGYLGFRRSQAVDESTKQAGIATGQSIWMGQVQDDNKTLRDEVRELRQTVASIQARLDAVEAGSTDLRAQNRELRREIGLLHDENEALKIENAGLKTRIGELERVNGGTT